MAMARFTALTKDKYEMCREMESTETQMIAMNEREKKKIDARLQRYLPSDGRGLGNRFSGKEIRLVLLGMTGSGKSATGSLLMGRPGYFKQSMSSTSVTGTIELGETMVNGIRMRIMDTPGFCDTSMDEYAICTEIAKVIEMFSDGVHGFLFVLSLGNPRFTDEQKKVFESSKKLFGKTFLENCFFILTHGKMLEEQEQTLDEYLMMERGKPLSDLLVGLLNKRVAVVDNSEQTQYGRQRLKEQTFNRISTRITGVYQGKAFIEAKEEKENALGNAMKNAEGIIAKLTMALEEQLKRKATEDDRRNVEVQKQEEVVRCRKNFRDAIVEMNTAILSELKGRDQEQLKNMDRGDDAQLCKRITAEIAENYSVPEKDLRKLFMDELNRVRERLIEPSSSVLEFAKGLFIPMITGAKKLIKKGYSALKSLF